MKKELTGILIFFLAISFVSAATLSDLLNQIDESTLVLYAIFIVSFVLLFFSLNKFFKENRTTSGIIAAAISLLLVYFVNKNGIDVSGFLYDLGVSSDALMTILPLVILGGIVIAIIKLAKNSLLVIGGALIFASFFVYAETLLLVVGITLVIIRFLIPKGKWEMKKDKNKDKGAGI